MPESLSRGELIQILLEIDQWLEPWRSDDQDDQDLAEILDLADYVTEMLGRLPEAERKYE